MYKWTLLVLCMLFCSIGNAQIADYVSLSFYHQAYALPGPASWQGTLHPGIEIGAGKTFRESEKTSQFFTARIGGYYHEKIETGIYLGGGYSFEYQALSWLNLMAGADLAYMHTFHTKSLYTLDPESGKYMEAKQFGRPHALGGVGIGAGFGGGAWQPFIRYSLRLETPFVIATPVIPQTALEVGIRRTFN
ncbi:MAG: hypothetical protein GYB31_05085 [Bacteroidetes bacterium]|nr:hypothetical protein [Bacteroidota bacterium]